MVILPNKALNRMTRSAVSPAFQFGRPWRVPRHRSALRQTAKENRFIFEETRHMAKKTSVPAVMLNLTIHDWNDEQCVKILENCRAAMNEKGRVLVVDN